MVVVPPEARAELCKGLDEASKQPSPGLRSWIQPGVSAGSCHGVWLAPMWCCAPWNHCSFLVVYGSIPHQSEAGIPGLAWS